jgi:PAS domain S-box-containing protein
MENKLYWNSLDFLNDLIEQIPAGIFWKDKNSVFLGCNQFFARLADIENPKSIVGKTDFDLPWAQFEAQHYVNDDQEVITSQKPKLDIEEYQTLSDGTECVLLTNKIPLFDKNGDVVGILGIFHDITRRKNMERLLEQEKNNAQMANLAKTEFITNMSHDIRTPLTGVIGLSHYLYEQLEDENTKQFAQWIFESGQQLLSLLNSILDLVSADALQEDDLSLEAFDLKEIVQEIFKMHRPTIVTKNLYLELDYDDDLKFQVFSDRAKLYRVLLNLLSNAIKFTPHGGITLKVKLLKKYQDKIDVEFSVSDTGIGIEHDLQSKVFERFYRAHPSYKGIYKGHGLGLHIAKTYIELMGGQIYLESTPGEGSKFYFKLTMDLIMNEWMQNNVGNLEQKFPSDRLLESYSLEPLDAKQSAIKLMLVEDNKIARKMVELFCAQLNIHLDCYESVSQALLAYEHHQYDLIITDIGLPDQSGYDLAQMIRVNESEVGAKPVPIIGLTAHAHYSVKNKCLNSGMQDVLNKPISIELLKSIVSAYCHFNSKEMPTQKPQIEEKLSLNYHHYEKYHLFNIEKAVSRLQSLSTLKEMVILFLEQDLLNNMESSTYAFEQGHYDFLQELVHKIRGGAIYCSTERLQKVSETMEAVLANQEEIQIKTLFPVWSYVLHQTIQQLQRWLSQDA